MYGLLQKCKIQLVATGLFEGPAIFVVLLVIVLVLILVLVGIIAAEIVSKVKKTDSPSDSRNSGDSVDDEWVKISVKDKKENIKTKLIRIDGIKKVEILSE